MRQVATVVIGRIRNAGKSGYPIAFLVYSVKQEDVDKYIASNLGDLIRTGLEVEGVAQIELEEGPSEKIWAMLQAIRSLSPSADDLVGISAFISNIFVSGFEAGQRFASKQL